MAVTAGMLTASVAACGASSGGDAPANGLVLYNGQHEQTTQALVSTLAAVPSADSSPAGNWVGVTARISALVYNTNALKPSQLPTSVMDLANPG